MECLLWYDNGSGYFDCASSHPTLAAAIVAAEKGWQTHQRITAAGGDGNNPAAIVWDNRWPWLSVTEAAEKSDVPVATIRYACASGHIAGAQKQHGRWRFAQPQFLVWLQNRPKRGPRAKLPPTP